MAQYTDVMFFEVICVSLLTSAALFRQMSFNFMTLCLQCFDAVGWVTGRASGL